MQVHGFFPALKATSDGDDLHLDQPAPARLLVQGLPTTAPIEVIVVFSADEPDEEVTFEVGLSRPDGSQAGNLTGFDASGSWRIVHLPIDVDLVEEGKHHLLLYPSGTGASALATYPFDVVVMPA